VQQPELPNEAVMHDLFAVHHFPTFVGLIAYRQLAGSIEKRENVDLQVIIGQFNNTLEKQD